MAITGTLTTDKTNYNTGDTMIATIKRTAVGVAATHPDTLTGTLTDAAGEQIVLASDPVTINTPGGPVASTVGAVTDSDGRVFVEVSDDKVTWVGTATA